ncbi:alpha/beta hydrolase [Candidatus Saccharibacteria bacterium]|nr:alpha/beta hydrolase [Candidatus Saccharibacteria bacterium]
MNYTSADETHFEISLADGKKLHGILRGTLDANSRVVVMMHGLIGSPKSLLLYLGSRFLHERGYTTLALYMYSYGSEYRDAIDCTLETHIADFKECVAYLQGLKVDKIFAIGHSYGGLTILGSNVGIDGAVLWDPSHGLAWSNGGDVKRNWSEKSDHMLISVDGPGSMRPIGAQKLNQSLGDTSQLASSISYPVEIISGDKSVIYKFQHLYVDAIPTKKNFVTIPNAGHSFDESDEMLLQVFENTAKWLDAIA